MLPFALLLAFQAQTPTVPPDGLSIQRPVVRTIRFLTYLPDNYATDLRARFPLYTWFLSHRLGQKSPAG